MSIIEKFKEQSGYPWVVFAIVALGTFMATLDSSIVNVALPTISRELNASLTVLQWVVTIYLLTISSILPIFGKLGDTWGPKKVYIYGFLVFILGSALCGLATNVTFLIASRVAQGIGAAMMMANNMGIVTAAFPSEHRGRALGSMGAVVAAGSLTGPSLGGFLVTNFGWASIFFINIPIGILGFFLGFYLLKHDLVKAKKGFDFQGALLFATSIVCLLLALSEGNQWGWNSWPVGLLFLGSLLIFLLFIVNEIKVKDPVIDLTLFRNPFFTAGILAALLSYLLLFFTIILMPFYLDNILGYSPVKTGLMMTPIPLALALVAPLSGWLSDRIGPVALTCGGMVVMGLGLAALGNLSLQSSQLEIVLKLFFFGTGIALFNSPNNSALLGSVSRDKLGIVGGLLATMRNVGMLMGIALSVAVFTMILQNYLAAQVNYKLAFIRALSKTFWLGSGLSILGILLSTVKMIKHKKGNNRES
mgnify:CR=1 FL=1